MCFVSFASNEKNREEEEKPSNFYLFCTILHLMRRMETRKKRWAIFVCIENFVQLMKLKVL